MSGFRKSFTVVGKAFNWYPKHMNTGMKQMQSKLRSVDCIVELHDARIPFSGRNPTFSDALIRDKPHILILNKVDLITRESSRRITELLEKSGFPPQNVVFTNCKDDRDTGTKKIIPLMKSLVEESDRFHRTFRQEYHAMIIGIPNVGKSSLINMLRSRNLRKGRALKVGPSAGVTKMVHQKVKICEDPLIYLFDTPGILTPRIDGDESGLKLATCSNLPDHDVGQMLIADYILYQLNKNGCKKYMKFLGLEEPTDCITTALAKGCIHLDLMNNMRVVDSGEARKNKPNFDLMAKMFIEKFRTGQFGKFVLDNLEDESIALKFNASQFELLSNETFVSS